MFKAKNELAQSRELIELIKDPSVFLSDSEFSEEGNQYRLQFLQFLAISVGLIILILLLKLIIG